MTEATPFWFGPEERRLFGWLHHAEDARRGGVVLCYPIGFEQVCAYRTYVVLAGELAAAGFVVLRFDYDGTGDSVGDYSDPDRLAAWTTSVGHAIEQLRALGVDHVAVVGMRIGATLAALGASGRADLDALVLWDPCTSGRAFIRQSKMLHVIGVDDPGVTTDDGSFEAAGQVFTAATAAELSALDLTRIGDRLAGRVLVLERADRPSRDTLVTHLQGTNDVDVGEAKGQTELFDVVSVEFAAVPEQAVSDITAWLERTMPLEQPGALWGAPAVPQIAVVGRTSDGREIREHAVRLNELGLFGIITETGGASGSPIICLNYGVAHHIGPSRLWVDMARRWASEGLRVLRLDLSGVGDSPARPGEPEHVSYMRGALDDVVDAIRAVSPDDLHDVVLIGVCSGAYQTVDVAGLHGVRGVCAINLNLRFKPADLLAGNTALPSVQRPTRSFVRRVSTSRFGDALQRRIPPLAWHALDRLGIHHSPAYPLERLAEQGVDTLLVYGDAEEGLYQLRRRGTYAVRKLERAGSLRVNVVNGMDHLLMLRRQREQLADVLTAHLVAQPSSPRE